MSDNPSRKDLPPEGRSAGHLPYGVDTIVIPFTWSDRHEVQMSGDSLSEDLPHEGHPAGHLPYGVDTIVIPFTWSGPQRRRIPWRRFGGNRWATGRDTPSYVGQSCAIAERQLATALRDVRQTSTELALSALQTLRGSSHSFHPHEAAAAAAPDAGLSTSSGTSNGDRGSLANGNVGGTTGGTTLPMLDVTRPGAPIAAANPDPYASSDVGGTTVRLGTVTLPGIASSPAGPVTSDGANNTINGGFIRQREGFTTDDIVPKENGNILGQSGVTVGNGVDLVDNI